MSIGTGWIGSSSLLSMEVCSLFWYISRFSVTIPRCYQNIYVNSFFPHKASFPLIEFYKILCNIHVLFIKTLNALRAYNFVMLLFPSLIIDAVEIFTRFWYHHRYVKITKSNILLQEEQSTLHVDIIDIPPKLLFFCFNVALRD